MPEESSAFDDFVLQAQKAAEKPETIARETYKDAVEHLLGEKPDITTPDLIRGVLRQLGFESSGADAMTDDELIRVVLAGSNVIRLAREHKKNQEATHV
jgi:hypothetical protein